MTWLKVTNPPASGDVAAVYEAEGWRLAKWDHSRCQGWQLYHRASRHSQRTRWVAGAEFESLSWTDDQAQEWAEEQIAAMNKPPSHGGA